MGELYGMFIKTQEAINITKNKSRKRQKTNTQFLKYAQRFFFFSCLPQKFKHNAII